MAFEKYMFTVDGTDYFIPHAAQIPSGMLRKVRKLPQIDGTFTILEELLGENSPELAALDSLPLGELNKTLNDWMGGASMGESVSSEN